jgi:hypothetical protein
MLAYSALFLYYYVTKQPDESVGWYDDYRRNWFEVVAYRNQTAKGGWGVAN